MSVSEGRSPTSAAENASANAPDSAIGRRSKTPDLGDAVIWRILRHDGSALQRASRAKNTSGTGVSCVAHPQPFVSDRRQASFVLVSQRSDKGVRSTHTERSAAFVIVDCCVF
jgi:hypothetical protein